MKTDEKKVNPWIKWIFRLVYFMVFVIAIKFLVPKLYYPEPMDSDNADDYTISAAINTDKSKDELCVFSKTNLTDAAILMQVKQQHNIIFPSQDNPVITRPCKEGVSYPATMTIK